MTQKTHPTTRKIAVLTGDLVGSTALGPEKVEQAFAALEDCARMQADWMDGQSLHFTRHRGDGWQVALEEPKYALRSALAFRASLRALGKEFDSYIGIAEGEVDKEIGPDLNKNSETVLIHSGELLEIIKETHDTMDIYMGYSINDRLGAMNAATVLADHLASGWTPAQASVIYYILSPIENFTLTKIAKILEKSRQSITKSAHSAGYAVLDMALSSIEDFEYA